LPLFGDCGANGAGLVLLSWDGGYFCEVDVVVDIAARRRRRVERLPPPPDAVVVVDFFFTSSSFNTLFLLLGGEAEVPPFEVELVSKDLLAGSDLDAESNTNGLVVVVDVVVSFAMIDLDVGIVWWCLLLFVVVLVSRGGVSYFEEGVPSSKLLFCIEVVDLVAIESPDLRDNFDIVCLVVSLLLDVFD